MSRGTAPPKPPPPSKIGLTEVERAISVLEGRHPEHEKIRRQTREAAEQRAREIEVELARSARTRLLRAVGVVAGAGAVTASLVFGWRLAQRTRNLRAALDSAEAPWLTRGFVEVTSNARTASQALEADLPASNCFVASATVDGRLRAKVGGAAIEGARSLAWCSCGQSRATIEAPAASAPIGLAVLRIEGIALGGLLARPWVDFTPGAWGDGGRECADAMLDGWIAGRRWPRPTLDEGWADADPSRAPLKRSGFRVVGAVEPARPFGIVETTPGDCAMAVGDRDAMLSLRAPGGPWLISHARGAVVWCSAAATTLTVWREGSSPVAVLASPASRIGGVLGARECAAEAGIRLASAAAWLRDEDLPWDAGCLLRASTLTDVTTAPLGVDAEAADPRIVGLALAPDSSVAAAPDAVFACDPAFGAVPFLRESVCAHGAPVSWSKKGGGAAGSARAPMPFWLSQLDGRREADALARIPELLSLARRLARAGFEPTRFEGVTELPQGVRITGRAGEDAVVAVGLSTRPPFVHPYSDGVPWNLGDSPRVVRLKAGDAVILNSSPPPTIPLSARRTVVFRHAGSP